MMWVRGERGWGREGISLRVQGYTGKLQQDFGLEDGASSPEDHLQASVSFLTEALRAAFHLDVETKGDE